MTRKASNSAKKHKKSRQRSDNPENHAAAAAVATATPDTTQAFETWLDDAGVVWRECCRLGEAAGRGQGVFAARDIAAGEVVLAVPDDAVLMPDDSWIAKGGAAFRTVRSRNDTKRHMSTSPMYKGFPKPLHTLQELQDAHLGHGGRGGARGEAIALALALMAESYAGTESRHAAYIESLPRALPGMPTCWDAEQHALLEGTAAADKLDGVSVAPGPLPDWGPSIELPSQVDMAWTEVAQPFVSQHSQHFGGLEANWRRRFDWATAIVAAYSFELGDDKFQAMVPLWDALNHVTGRCNVRLHHDEDDECLQMIATESVPAGGELVNNYGELGNAELLRRFGFVEQKNVHDCAQVPWTELYDIGVRVASESAVDFAKHHELLRSEQELKRRWKRLVKTKAVPDCGYFSIPRNGRPDAQVARAIQMMLATLRSRAGTWRRLPQDDAQQHDPAAACSRACTSDAQPPAADGCAGSRKAKKQKADQRRADAEASAAAAPPAADVLRVFMGLMQQADRYYKDDDGPATSSAQELEAGLLQDPASSAWRRAAALLVRDGELACWRAFVRQWLASPDVEQQIVDMLASRQ